MEQGHVQTNASKLRKERNSAELTDCYTKFSLKSNYNIRYRNLG